jgi:hypothetical protein
MITVHLGLPGLGGDNTGCYRCLHGHPIDAESHEKLLEEGKTRQHQPRKRRQRANGMCLN